MITEACLVNLTIPKSQIPFSSVSKKQSTAFETQLKQKGKENPKKEKYSDSNFRNGALNALGIRVRQVRLGYCVSTRFLASPLLSFPLTFEETRKKKGERKKKSRFLQIIYRKSASRYAFLKRNAFHGIKSTVCWGRGHVTWNHHVSYKVYTKWDFLNISVLLGLREKNSNIQRYRANLTCLQCVFLYDS